MTLVVPIINLRRTNSQGTSFDPKVDHSILSKSKLLKNESIIHISENFYSCISLFPVEVLNFSLKF